MSRLPRRWALLALGALTVLAVATFSLTRRAPATGPRSCRGGAPGAGDDCGIDRGESCCTALVVPGGSVLRSFDGVHAQDKGHPATVSSFGLDRFDVTVGRFRAFLDAGGGTQKNPPPPGDGADPHLAGSGWQSEWNASLEPDRASLSRKLHCGDAVSSSWTDAPGANENLPVNCLTWYEAFAFCAWDGGRLPTEAEWNYAAAGGSEQRVYPWSKRPGDEYIDPTYAVYSQPRVQAVGTHSPNGDGRWGQADLVGNVWEWQLDRAPLGHLLPAVGANYYDPFGYPLPCVDCIASEGDGRVLRGAGFGIAKQGLRVAIRRADLPQQRFHVFGVRCARAAKDAVVWTRSSPETGAPPACRSNCDLHECGPDGCGGECGHCAGQSRCGADGFCRIMDYPLGPYGFAKGSVLDDLALRVIRDPAHDLHKLTDSRFSDFYHPAAPPTSSDKGAPIAGEAPRALVIHLGAAWSSATDDSVKILNTKSQEMRKRGATFLLVLVDGQRKGQRADAYNLVDFISAHPVAFPVAMDPGYRVRPQRLPLNLLVDPRTMRVLEAQPEPPSPDSALWRALDRLLNAPAAAGGN